VRVIQLIAKAGTDGKLHLVIPVGAGDEEYEVAVVVQSRPAARKFPEGYQPTPEELGWPVGFLETVIGSIEDESFVAPPRHPAKPIPPLDAE
jgi:hypothetical protein